MRAMTGAMLSAMTATLLRPAILIQAQFVTGTVYLWTGSTSLSWSGHTWLGAGSLLGVSEVEEGSDVTARGIVLSLSGINQALLADVLQQFQLTAPVTLYFGLFDASFTLIADPVVMWSGRMDQPTIDVGGDTATLSINCESRLLDMNVGVDRRYTHDDAQIDNLGDLGFQFVNGIQELNIYWGKVPTSTNNL